MSRALFQILSNRVFALSHLVGYLAFRLFRGTNHLIRGGTGDPALGLLKLAFGFLDLA